jgi:5-methylcytosine-specific restriction protein A
VGGILIAAAITEAAQAGKEPDSSESDDDEEFAEGRVLTRLHKRRERNRAAVSKKKTRVLQEAGKLDCEVCGFDFVAHYGELGKGFAECHHIAPLASLPKKKSVRLADLAIVCANCHRMLHRRGHSSIAALKALVESRRY